MKFNMYSYSTHKATTATIHGKSMRYHWDMADIEYAAFLYFCHCSGLCPLDHPYEGAAAPPLLDWNAKSDALRSAK